MEVIISKSNSYNDFFIDLLSLDSTKNTIDEKMLFWQIKSNLIFQNYIKPAPKQKQKLRKNNRDMLRKEKLVIRL